MDIKTWLKLIVYLITRKILLKQKRIDNVNNHNRVRQGENQHDHKQVYNTV